ncbi:hypothetical protein FAZ15_08660 [Sphingobacterium olei]|uniref:Lipoprotein n=1 Tax=Sphingobacterium olei TaxID=2571155 RepID=A0A4U0P2D0_9SPHI|nr:hypothetical protein [Sphingobacterium olei]TJZ61260.1 hypothetical protein FAZ15_08660 [Sphingobacterium olei]
MRKLAFLLIIAALSGCKSYDFVKNGYIVKGDDQFVSLDRKLTVNVGADFMVDKVWQHNKPPVNTAKLSRESRKILKSLGYSSKAYSTLFSSRIDNENAKYDLLAMINNHGIQKSGKDDLLDLSRLARMKTRAGGRWFYETLTLNQARVYHAVIPVSDELWSERYLSMIYVLPKSRDSNLQDIESIVAENAFLQYSSSFFPMKTVLSCPNDDEMFYYEYEIPKLISNRNEYMILRVSSGSTEDEKLIYYTVINPGLRLGAFKICRGNYTLTYTTLQGKEIWSSEIVVEN